MIVRLFVGYPANIDGEPSTIMKSRVEMGVTLYKKDKIKFLILSGGQLKMNIRKRK